MESMGVLERQKHQTFIAPLLDNDGRKPLIILQLGQKCKLQYAMQEWGETKAI